MENNLRIGLMGSASLGKTTSAKKIHEILGIEFQGELETRIVKRMIERGEIDHKYDFTPEESKKFQNRALAIRERLSLRNNFVSDRSAGELWVYHQVYCGPHSTDKELEAFRERSKKVMQRYTHLFLFPFGIIPIEDNNYRTTYPNYQKMIHNKIEEMLSDFGLRYIQLEKVKKTKEERIEEILSWTKI